VTGRAFGYLTALRYRGAGRWLWGCRCGGHVTAELEAVEDGRVQHCGCPEEARAWRDRPGSPALRGGEVFGQLVTTEYLGGGQWRCQCACGGEATVSAGRLRLGQVRSCGGCVRVPSAD
jgi:hypothetical protein